MAKPTITITDLRIQFSKEEGIRYDEIVTKLPKHFGDNKDSAIYGIYINWLEQKLLEEWTKE